MCIVSEWTLISQRFFFPSLKVHFPCLLLLFNRKLHRVALIAVFANAKKSGGVRFRMPFNFNFVLIVCPVFMA